MAKTTKATDCAVLTRPDRASAAMAARLCGKAVQVTGETSETALLYANPNGTLESKVSSAPVRFRHNNTWVTTDLTLKAQPDGSVVPAAHPAGVRFTGAQASGTGTLASVNLGGDTVAMQWTGALPAPTLQGSTATYPNVLPGVDLVLRATLTGFEENLVAKDAAAARRAEAVSLPVTSRSLRFVNDATGAFAIKDTAGRMVGRVPSPQAWDDSQPAGAGSHGPEKALAVTVKPRGADTRTAKAATGGVAGDAAAGTGGVDLQVSAADGWLDDPATVYPVTIDPTVQGQTPTSDTYVKSDDTIDHSAANDLEIGRTSGAVTRSLLQWDTSAFAYGQVLGANLYLWNWYSESCTARQWEIWTVGAYANPVTWAGQPGWQSLETSTTLTHGYSSACDDAWDGMDVTSFFRRNAAFPNSNGLAYMGLKATDESGSFKQFRSRQAVDPSQVPYIDITFDSAPTAANQTTTPSTAGCVTGSARPYISSATPKLQATATDPDGGTVNANFEWYTVGGARIDGAGTTVPSGSQATVTVPAGELVNGGSYSWRVAVNDGTVSSPWYPFCEVTVDTTPPASPATVSSTTYPQNQWSATANTPGTFTLGAAGVTDVASYLYGLDSNPPTTSVNAAGLGAGASVSITPTADGPHTLYVQSVDRAGNVSPLVAYPFNVGTGGVTTLSAGANLAGKTSLAASTNPTVTGVTYQWRRADTDTWATIPITDVAVAAGGGPVTWPQPASGAGSFAKLTWNAEATLAAADPSHVAQDGPLQVRLSFTGGPGGASSPVKINLDRSQATTATQQIGPGTVNLLTGNLALSASDVSIDSWGSDLTVTRTYNTRRYGSLDGSGMFGPGWTSGVTVSNPQAPYTSLTVTGSLVQVGLPDGTSLGFTAKTVTSAGTVYDPPLDSQDLSLSSATAANTYTLKDLDGNQVVFGHLAAAAAGSYQPVQVTSPGTGQTTTFSWEKTTVDGHDVVRPTQALAPVPAGVSCVAVVRGCRALAFTYATATTATATAVGDYTGRVTQISFTAYDPDTAAMTTTAVARYTYDNTGRLRQAWDPRLDYATSHVATGYTYTTDGTLDTYTPPGQQPWQLGYTTLPTDTGKGRLNQVTRSALTAGTAVSTVVYHVPTTGTGAPDDLSGVAALSWGQSEAPVDATAVYGPDQQPDGNQATGQFPSSYERATVIYLDADGHAVDTAEPGGYLDATWYDGYGNTVRTMTAGNLQTALASSTDVATQAAAAARLSTINTYSADGQRLLDTVGPEHDVTLPDGSTVTGRAHTVTTYDEGAPNTGGPYNLATTTVISARYTTAAGTIADADAHTSTTAYNWPLHKPTAVTNDATGLALTDRTTYDPDTGLALSTTKPAGGTSTSTPATTTTVYYRAGTGSGSSECDGRPEWANLACRTQPGGQAATGPELPITAVTYDRYDQPRTVTDKTSAGGVLRTTTTTYDTAARLSTTTVTSAASTAVPVTRRVYDQATGQLLSTQSLTATGTVASELTSTYDTLGRQTSYTDADGNVTSTTYDLLSRPASVTDRISTRTMTYDSGTERRGLLTQVDDSQAGTFTADHDANGAVYHETWPTGITVDKGYNSTGDQTGVAYTKPGCGQADCTLYADYTGLNTAGQERWNNSTLASQTYGYDRAGRLTLSTDTYNGSCTIHAYGYDTNTNRTVDNLFAANPDGSCNWNTQTSSRSWNYDTADRTTMTGYTYDPLGRTTTTPAGDTQTSGNGNLTTAYHTNDLVRSITQGNHTTTYTLDADNQRIRSWTDTNSSTTTSQTNHYADPGDSPSWTTDNGANYTRAIDSVGGLAAIYTAPTNRADWQLSNLHGDVVATVQGVNSALSTTTIADENGGLQNTAAGTVRYGWLGDAERAADTPAGVVLMGVRLYNPAVGRFLQADPVPGGSCNAYGYVCGDPVNNRDLDGKKCRRGFGWLCKATKTVTHWVRANKAELVAGVTFLAVGAACWGGAIMLGIATGGVGIIAGAVCGVLAGAAANAASYRVSTPKRSRTTGGYISKAVIGGVFGGVTGAVVGQYYGPSYEGRHYN